MHQSGRIHLESLGRRDGSPTYALQHTPELASARRRLYSGTSLTGSVIGPR
jgi:hypothetical protein